MKVTELTRRALEFRREEERLVGQEYVRHYEDGSIGVMCHSCNRSDGVKQGGLRGAVKALVEGGGS